MTKHVGLVTVKMDWKQQPTSVLCECSHFVTLRQEIWGKSYLHPSEADLVQNLVRFIHKSHRFS